MESSGGTRGMLDGWYSRTEVRTRRLAQVPSSKSPKRVRDVHHTHMHVCAQLRSDGTTTDTYYLEPSGKRFRSRREVLEYFGLQIAKRPRPDAAALPPAQDSRGTGSGGTSSGRKSTSTSSSNSSSKPSGQKTSKRKQLDWSHLEVFETDLVADYPPFAKLEGSDVCVVASDVHGSADWGASSLTREGSIGWRGSITRWRGTSTQCFGCTQCYRRQHSTALHSSAPLIHTLHTPDPHLVILPRAGGPAGAVRSYRSTSLALGSDCPMLRGSGRSGSCRNMMMRERVVPPPSPPESISLPPPCLPQLWRFLV